MILELRLLVPLAFAVFMSSHAHGWTGRVGLRILHRFSEEALEIWRQRDRNTGFPTKGHTTQKQDLHGLLHREDHRRHLAAFGPSSGDTLSFASSNETMDYGEDYGWLHYAVIDIGTPNISFLVALDTGSDLLWVPCECKQCASSSSSSQQLEIPLNVYNPAASKTSKRVTCNSSSCISSKKCESKSEDCLYDVRYVSANTYTSGVLVEDVIYLRSERHYGKAIQASVTFGCGQVQSGNFLSSGAPDGLLGLGFGAIALPNALAKEGLVTNSFSMCFEPDGSGRIFFGDKGSASQQTTSFLASSNGTHVRYVVGLDQILIGSSRVNMKGLDMIVDSGTSFTYLPTELYSAVTSEFDAQVPQQRAILSDVPWQFCYKARNDDVQAPAISMVFGGGGNFSVFSPLIGIDGGNGTMDAFCLAILQSDIAILGQSFMTGYQLVFNREDMQLGWSPSDCYKLEEDADVNAAAPSTSLSASAPKPLTASPLQGAPPPANGATPTSGTGVPSRGNSNVACQLRSSYTLFSFLSTLFINQVLWLSVAHFKC